MRKVLSYPLEALIWLAAFVVLAAMDPTAQIGSICPLHNLGFEYCPGCGLGQSISFLFHGQFEDSWQAHPLGLPAIILLTLRIIKLTKTFIYYGQNY